MPFKYFQIEGVATFLRHTGPTTLPDHAPDFGELPLLLCLHHTAGNESNFQGLSEGLEADCGVLAFDFPGHDRSGRLDSLGDIDALAAFTGALTDKLGLASPILLGHDMGAAVALQRALDAPAQVRALVLCAPALPYPFDDAMLERARLVTEGKARRDFDMSLFSKKASPEVFKTGYMDTVKTDPRVVYPNLVACRDWSTRPDLAEQLARIECPVLVCVGEDERADWAEAANAVIDAIPAARKVVLPGAGHMLPLEQPQALAEEIRRFLGERA